VKLIPSGCRFKSPIPTPTRSRMPQAKPRPALPLSAAARRAYSIHTACARLGGLHGIDPDVDQQGNLSDPFPHGDARSLSTSRRVGARRHRRYLYGGRACRQTDRAVAGAPSRRQAYRASCESKQPWAHAGQHPIVRGSGAAARARSCGCRGRKRSRDRTRHYCCRRAAG
jgi:hypothetical protein